MLRLTTAAVLLSLLWVVIHVAPPWTFHVFVLLMIMVACWEAYRILEVRGLRPFKWLGMLGCGVLVWSLLGLRPAYEAGLPLVALTFFCLVLGMRRRSGPAETVDATTSTLLPVVMIGLPLAYLIALRAMPGEDGKDLLMLVFVCVIALDTFAYYVGRTLGRRRLAPRLSPRKTWEGALGGLLACVCAAWLAQLSFYQRLPLTHALVLGLLLGTAGIFGDLAESLFKRSAGVKDSSSLLPGHGGVLDRTDSLLFAAPVLYYYYVTFLRVTS